MATKREGRQSALPIIIGAVVCGLVAALLGAAYLKTKESQIRASLIKPEPAELTVVVASRDLPPGATVSEANFAARSIPSEFVHQDAIRAGDFDRYEGRAITTGLGAGKTLLRSFMDETFPVDFSDTIPDGRRAMTVTVDEVNSVAGFIRPGNRIDLFVTLPYQASGLSAKLITAGVVKDLPSDLQSQIPAGLLEALNTTTSDLPLEQLLQAALPDDVIIPVVQDIHVLATGRDPYRASLDKLRQPQQRTEQSFSTLTVNVSPRQAALINTAIDKGQILALLRNRKDRGSAEFTTLSTRDLFNNAEAMARAGAERAGRVSIAAGVDRQGDLVDSSGKTLVSRSALEAAGYRVNAKGQLVDKHGNVVDPKDLVTTPDGRVINKADLAKAGLTVNAQGQITDKNGNVVAASDVVTTADGRILTKAQLATAGLRVNAAGEIVDSQGRIVNSKDIVVKPDGRVTNRAALVKAVAGVNDQGDLVDASGKTLVSRTALEAAGYKIAAGVNDQGDLVDASGKTLVSRAALEAAGYRVNEKGQIVDKHGNVVDPKTLITKDGKVVNPKDLVVTPDGRVLNGAVKTAAGVNDEGDLVDASGKTLVTRAALEAAGYRVNAKGQIVDKHGHVVDPKNLITTADGRVINKAALEKAGFSVNAEGHIVDKNGDLVAPDQLTVTADGTVVSKDQLAKAGLSLNDKGEIVDASGKIVSKDDLVVTNDGQVVSRQQLAAAGLSVNEKGEIIDQAGNVVDAAQVAKLVADVPISGAERHAVDMIIGGASKDGVAKSTKLETSD